jgi:hypothetical protein
MVRTAVLVRWGRHVTGCRDQRFASPATFFSERFGIDDVRLKVEVVPDPLFEIGVPFVLGVPDGVEKLGVAQGAAKYLLGMGNVSLDNLRLSDVMR